MGGFRHEPRNLFERMIHHKWAFPVISVVGGLILISGTFLLFTNNSTSNPTKAVRPVGSAVRGTPGPGGTATPAAAEATATPGPQRSFSAAPAFSIDPSASYSATLKTDKGDIVVQLDPKSAPIAVNNFVFLAQNHFYDGLSFQRVDPGFVAQAGSTTADGTGGPGYTVQDDNSPAKHAQGAVAMAESTTQTNSAGSQFYVVLAPSIASQDGRDTVFGHVTTGLDILQSLPARNPGEPGQPPALQIQAIEIAKQ
jgi:cyclophilin family peptidyl-prolyl cis-trans isomerase